MEDTDHRTEVRGIDNRGATEDDGTPVRPDLVISVQPTHGGDRAHLPVSTLDWSTNTRGQFIPVHGLDFLIGVSSLLIQQTVELNDLTSKIESENRYIVRVPNGEALYIASETSSSTQRCLCGTGRAFVLHLHDNTRQEAMVFTRRLAAASCCFPCRLQDKVKTDFSMQSANGYESWWLPTVCDSADYHARRTTTDSHAPHTRFFQQCVSVFVGLEIEIKVVTPPGDYVGRVQQQCTWMVPFFLVRDANDEVLFAVEGPTGMQRSALLISEFKIMTGDSLRVVGKIAHGWDRELNSFTTTLQVPSTAVQPKHIALLMAAAFLLEYTYFEKSKSSCCTCNCF